MESKSQKWYHPGGKVRELGADNLTDSELLAILIAPGIKGKSAEDTAADILGSFASTSATLLDGRMIATAVISPVSPSASS